MVEFVCDVGYVFKAVALPCFSPVENDMDVTRDTYSYSASYSSSDLKFPSKIQSNRAVFN